MLVLQKIITCAGIITCALVETDTTHGSMSTIDADLLFAFYKKRTRIWSYKYHEPVNECGLEVDPADAHASVIVLFTGTETDADVIGGCRLIHTEVGNSLPVGECTDHAIPGPAVEVSRFFLAPDIRSTTKEECAALMHSLVDGIDMVLVHHGLHSAYATVRANLFKKLADMGVPMERIGENREHGGKQFIPAKMLVRNEDIARARLRYFAHERTMNYAKSA